MCANMFSPPTFTSPPTTHGKNYEQTAITIFQRRYNKTVEKCGLFIHPSYPFLGASPDGVVMGEQGIVEVKCPWEGRDSKIKKGKKGFPFLEDYQGSLRLKRSHNYFYQIQGQLYISRRELHPTHHSTLIWTVSKSNQCV